MKAVSFAGIFGGTSFRNGICWRIEARVLRMPSTSTFFLTGFLAGFLTVFLAVFFIMDSLQRAGRAALRRARLTTVLLQTWGVGTGAGAGVDVDGAGAGVDGTGAGAGGCVFP